MLEDIFLGRVPEDGIIDRGMGKVLSDAFDPRWKPVNFMALRSGHSDLLHVNNASSRIVP